MSTSPGVSTLGFLITFKISLMKNLFNSVKLTKPNKNAFDLSHDIKFSANMGFLVPILCMECVPSDRVTLSCEGMVRMAPMLAPIMQRIDITYHYWFVPNRIIWKNWENFITKTKVGGADVAFPVLAVEHGGNNYTPLMDYMGVPTPPGGAGPDEVISALPFAAYQAIINEFYRDQNLQSPVDYVLDDGDNTARAALYTLRRRAWEHDYFTSALPFAQKGDAVTIPVGGFQDVPVFQDSPDDTVLTGTPNSIAVDGVETDSPTVEPLALYADTSALDVGSTTINDLRTAYRLQEFLEKLARAGSRYAESILSFFGVRPQDARLQRPEYITGSKTPITISEVLNMTGTDDAPQGTMAGHGLAYTKGKYGSYFCQEHGYVLCLASIMPKSSYMQGIPKHFTKTVDPTQYFFPEFANLGEQEIKERELYAYDASSNETFGYTPRYAEYKYMSSRVAGDFKTSLNFWHMGRIFTTPPALTGAFIQMDSTTTDRVFAVTDPDVQKFWIHVYHTVKAIRPMPKYGTPTF